MKKFFILLAILAGVSVAGFGITNALKSNDAERQDEFTIVTSFILLILQQKI